MTHILRIWQSKLTTIYKLRFGKASQKCLQIWSFNYYYRTTSKKVSTYQESNQETSESTDTASDREHDLYHYLVQIDKPVRL